MVKTLLQQRDLLPILQHDDGTPVSAETWERRRCEMREALEKYSYGHTLPAPWRVWGEVVDEKRWDYAGKVWRQDLKISFETERGVFSFDVWLFIPNRVEKPPVFVHIAFRRTLPDSYVPVEEITDAGYALAVVCYEDLVNDAHFGDFSDGLAAYFGVTTERGPEEWGKIGLWAYGLSRLADYLWTREELDRQRMIPVGHSRLGKTVLWAAAQDERFWGVAANDSGYGGASTSKYGEGERVTDFIHAGSWDWFCGNFLCFSGEKENSKPYDQSWLLALIAPRYLCVGTAEKDCDPKSEFLTTAWASQAWEFMGVPGLIAPNRLPQPGEAFHEGRVGYQLRPGLHFLSREDWNDYIRFFDRKRAEEKQ